MSKSAISITTSDYLEEKHVLVDGRDWVIKLPGAGTELRISQAQRRMKLLDKKINDGSASEEDYDLYDKLENNTITVFENMFNDGTTENESVKQWIQETPMGVIMAAFEEIKKQAEENKKADDGGTTS
jgi:hypothetical protein